MPRVDGMNRCVEIEYADIDGVVTRRKVNVEAFNRSPRDHVWYIQGFCHLRRASRTFRLDRTLRLWDGRSGWTLIGDPGSWIEGMLQAEKGSKQTRTRQARERIEGARDWQKDLDALFAEQDAIAKLRQTATDIVEQHMHALRALLYVAKADKAFRAAERRLFLFFFKRVAGGQMETEELEAQCLKAVSRLDAPSTGQFQYSARQLASRDRAYRMAVCATAKAMINSDKTVAPYEVEVFDYLTRKLKPMEG
jgi:WYL domain-containing protein